jgi:salicylate hydroxylase
MCVYGGRLVNGVFHTYNAVRRPRTQKLVTTSRNAGLFYDFQKEDEKDGPELFKQGLLERVKWVWNID